MSDDDILEEARAAFRLAADAEAENRRDALDDLRFARLGEQWPEKVRREREMEGRPCLTINRLPTFIRQVVNDARQNKDPRLVRSADAPPGAHQATRRRLCARSRRQPGRQSMRSWIVAVAGLSLSACSPISAITGAPGASRHNETLKALGEHIDGCDRRYQGGVGLGASFTFNIDCKARPAPEI